MYVEGAVVTAFGLLALTVLRRFEDKNVQRRRVSVALGGAADVAPVLEAVHKLGARTAAVDYEGSVEGDQKKSTVTFDLQLSGDISLPGLLGALESIPDVRRVHIQHVT